MNSGTLIPTEREYVEPGRVRGVLKFPPLDKAHRSQAKSHPPHI